MIISLPIFETCEFYENEAYPNVFPVFFQALSVSKPAQIIRQIDRSLGQMIETDLPILKKVKVFVIKSGGKRVRPLLHYYLAKVLDYQGKEWQDVGAIGEIIHAASLLHDDVIDEANLRRNRPSLNHSHGNKVSVLSGDYLLACGLHHLSTLQYSLELLPLFSRTVRMLALGELIQARQEGIGRVSENIYEKVMFGKTAVLFGCMAEAAYVLAGLGNLNGQMQLSYRHFGERLGRLFQIRDDFLDYFQSPSASGKERYQDLRRGLVTRPIIVLYKHLKAKDRRTLLRIFSTPQERNSQRGKQTICLLFGQANLRQRLEREIEEEVHALIGFLRKHPPSPYRTMLLEQLVKLLVSE